MSFASDLSSNDMKSDRERAEKQPSAALVTMIFDIHSKEPEHQHRNMREFYYNRGKTLITLAIRAKYPLFIYTSSDLAHEIHSLVMECVTSDEEKLRIKIVSPNEENSSNSATSEETSDASPNGNEENSPNESTSETPSEASPANNVSATPSEFTSEKTNAMSPEGILAKYPRIKEIRDRDPMIVNDKKNTRDTALYTALTWLKIKCLEDVARRNDFCCTHYCWIDFGMTHLVDYPYWRDGLKNVVESMWAKPEFFDKAHVNIAGIVDWQKVEDDPASYWSTYTHGCCGGMIGGNRMAVLNLCRGYWSLAQRVLEMGYAPLEQALLAYMIRTNVHDFQIWYGQYCDVGVNWGGIHRPPSACYVTPLCSVATRYGLQNMHVNYCNLVMGEEIAGQVLEGCRQKRFELTGGEKASLLNDMYMCRWYRLRVADPHNIYTSERDKIAQCETLAYLILDYYENDKECREAIEQLRPIFEGNLGLVGLLLE